MKGVFTNLQIFPDESMLFAEEIDVLTMVTYEILTLFDKCPKKGTIILDGQKKGEDARCIVRVNLEGGVFRKKSLMDFNWTSERLAEESIDIALSWPRDSSYGYADPKCFGEMPTGIYKSDPLRVMVLNATFGRFLMSVHLADEDDLVTSVLLTEYLETGRCLMKGLAVALERMRPEDLVLRRSVKKLYGKSDKLEEHVKDEVENMFCFCNLPALATWKEWHKAAMAKGNGLALYFGEEET